MFEWKPLFPYGLWWRRTKREEEGWSRSNTRTLEHASHGPGLDTNQLLHTHTHAHSHTRKFSQEVFYRYRAIMQSLLCLSWQKTNHQSIQEVFKVTSTSRQVFNCTTTLLLRVQNWLGSLWPFNSGSGFCSFSLTPSLFHWRLFL